MFQFLDGICGFPEELGRCWLDDNCNSEAEPNTHVEWGTLLHVSLTICLPFVEKSKIQKWWNILHINLFHIIIHYCVRQTETPNWNTIERQKPFPNYICDKQDDSPVCCRTAE